MRKQTAVRAALLVVSLGAALAQAQTSPPPPASSSVPAAPAWTVDSGQTIGDGNSVVRGQIGWPGIFADYIHGLSSTFDIGGRFGFDWGGYGGGFQSGFGVGLDFQLLLRIQAFDIGGYKGAFTFNPGFILSFPSGGAQAGITFPIGAQIGFPINDKFVVNASLELPFFVTFGNGSGGAFFIPILLGGGVEYQFQPNLAFTGKLALGPSIGTNGFGTVFDLQFLAGVAYKL
jgi:hypothetical protein